MAIDKIQSPKSPRRSSAAGACVLGLAAAFAFLACSIRFLDLPLAIWFHAHVTAEVYAVSEAVSAVGGSSIYVTVALVIYVLSLVGVRRGWRCPVPCGFDRLTRGALLTIFTMALGGALIALLKAAIARARPELFFKQGFYGFGDAFGHQPQFNSFPSSHTMTAFVIAAAVGQAVPRWRWPLLVLASFVALARVVETDHYLSDVVASALIAMALAAWLAPRILSHDRAWALRTPWRWGRVV